MKTPINPGAPPLRPFHALCSVALLSLASAAQAEVKLTFDADAQGFTQQGDATSAGWVNDPEFGGCLEIAATAGWRPNCAELNVYSNAALTAELANAAAFGGTIKFTLHVRQAQIQGDPGYFGIIMLSNSEASYTTDVPAYVGGFPLASTYTTVVELPVQAVSSGGGIGGNAIYEYMSASGYNLLSFGLNSGNGTITAGTFYIDDLTVSGAAPPAAGAYTFDTDKQGFKKFGTDPEPGYSTNFGGTLEFSPTNTDFHFWANKSNATGNELQKLIACATSGGTISYDLIAPTGYLANRGISTILQNHNPGYLWNQVDVAIPPASVQALPGGFEVARINLPASSFTGLIASDGYDFNVAFSGFDVTPVTVHFDNLTFAPYYGKGDKLTFTSSLQNFVSLDGSISAATGTVELDSLTNALVWGAKAVFSATDPDPQVVAVQGRLQEALTKGGALRLKITRAVLASRELEFTGVTVKIGYNPTTGEPTPTQEQSIFIPASAFTEGETLETPATFSQFTTIPLYPPGSTATNGLVLEASANQDFFVGTEVIGAASVRIYFDDFEVLPTADPEIIYAPALPTGSASFVGRVLTNAEPGATYSATGLPPGITIDAGTGLVSGTPTTNGTYNVTFSVTRNGLTDTTASVPWVISGVVAGITPIISSFTITGNTAVVSWTGTGTTPATVLRSTSLAEGDWTAVSTGNSSGTYTDTSAPPGKAFYRVSVP